MNNIPLPIWIRPDDPDGVRHVQLYVPGVDGDLLVCGYVRGVYALGIEIEDCTSGRHKFFLWHAIGEIWPVEDPQVPVS